MRTWIFALGLTVAAASALRAADASQNAHTVVLDEAGVQNLRIQTVVAEPGDFEETVFALGAIEARPSQVAVVSSRIPGRIVALGAQPGDVVNAGAELARVESRQPGHPPPSVGLTAPLGGMVMRLDVRLGDPVEPDRALIEIADLSEVFAMARVPEHLVGRLRDGTQARIRIAAVPDAVFDGQLLRFGTAADPIGGTLVAIFVLKNPENRIRPGMRAEFSIVVERRSDVLRVPRSAVQGEPANRFVYVRDFELPNAFVKAPVVTGQSNDQYVEILQGLLPADEVVTQGAYSLAFAGGGSLSLKEALDAAHGHPHNPDGSELTDEQKTGAAAASAPLAGGESPFWMIVSGVLFVLLVVAVSIRRRSPASSASGQS